MLAILDLVFSGAWCLAGTLAFAAFGQVLPLRYNPALVIIAEVVRFLPADVWMLLVVLLAADFAIEVGCDLVLVLCR